VNVRAFPALLQDTMLVAKAMNTSAPTAVVEALRLRVQCREGRAIAALIEHGNKVLREQPESPRREIVMGARTISAGSAT
jgi:hypothetical protein